MASHVCWHCGVTVHMTLVPGSSRWIEGLYNYQKLTAAYACDACQALSIAIHDQDLYTRGDVEQILMSEEVLRWLPEQAVHREFPDAPEHIAAAGSEAFACYSIRAFRAAAAVARAVVEATAKDKGITDGSLAANIDKLADRGLIRADIRLAAHEVRQGMKVSGRGRVSQEVSRAFENAHKR